MLAVLAAVTAAGCSWGGEEPGLFRTPRASTAPQPSAPADLPVPAGTNPALPVAGEAVWTSADGNDVTVRFAVHAVRRTEDATVLDWSVTPLVERGRPAGQPLPSGTDLGLGRAVAGEQNLALLDLTGRRVFRPLASTTPGKFRRCLCTPLFVLTPTLRFGETRLLQLAFPALPEDVRSVDVWSPNVAALARVPVTAAGAVPTARRPVDLTRPAARTEPATTGKTFVRGDGASGRETVRVDRVVAAPGLTTVEWTLHAVDDQTAFPASLDEPPTALPLPAGVRVGNRAPADGPRVRAAGTSGPWLGVRWTTASFAGLAGYECVCSEIDLWARGLRYAGGSASVASTLPGLPAGTARVDVALPGLPVFRDVPVRTAPDARAGLGPGTARDVGRWHYVEGAPPTGWSTEDWPTPLPEPAQVSEHQSRPERLLDALP